MHTYLLEPKEQTLFYFQGYRLLLVIAFIKYLLTLYLALPRLYNSHLNATMEPRKAVIICASHCAIPVDSSSYP